MALDSKEAVAISDIRSLRYKIKWANFQQSLANTIPVNPYNIFEICNNFEINYWKKEVRHEILTYG